MSTQMTLSRGGMSAYRQIAQILRGRLAAGQAAADDGRLPTEGELAAEFNVSRHTVRAAVGSLVRDGLVERFPGRGTFVVNRGADGSTWRIRSLEDIIDQRFPEPPVLLGTRKLCGSDDLEAAAALQLGGADEMVRISALRRIERQPYTCSTLFVPADIGEAIAPDVSGPMDRRPLVRIIEERCSIVAARAVQTASAAPADARISKALDIPAGTCVFMLLRTYFSTDDRPFEHVRMFSRPDLYNHTIEFSRQRQ